MTHKLPVNLTDAQIEEFGREMDAIYNEVMDSRGEKDRAYILKVIRTQRSMAVIGRIIIYAGLFFIPAWGHALASWGIALGIMAIGTFMLGCAKILENMEIGHNVMHAQWDWMKDPEIQSNTWEWDNMSPSDRWMNSHNVVHHTWTNVLEKDLDVGYGILRVTPMQPWKPSFLLQPLWFILLMLLFEEGVALHEQVIDDTLKGKKTWKETLPMFRHIGRKVRGQVIKDYLMWPLAAMLVSIPISFYVPASPFLVFGLVAGANAIANIIRNVWAFVIIFCGHFPAGVHTFTLEQVEGETRARWYLRQMLGSANIEGGKLFHIMSGNLSHQIEHHIFPDMCSNRYPEVSPRVEALAARYGIPYNRGSLTRQFGTTWWNNIRLAFPNS
ncbi:MULTISPECIES: acyl-CoA desaturase [unclassified Acinetobacter]|uniref:fatty acid desaturase family protein n=1 Tax=unclassified Acinetobacter TaxID=196816 RepID=UPI00244AD605|nr:MULTISPECIES: acyl-CoA desaturase [unclassified Acinetobacter]MDH0031288.1 acyl-CoA desaturase [Acinetobacter sp. GD04021]MDH0887033.1 acyl-CoA desaturase [Acinetobacter sp. GD03873]MDH1083484.1 acyl-CoA desaturase [Acinetobacter sp. GD03983]MDH2190349.1 acyl-CoA desaturase [Acinetobacter sp. GD03645]MDH2203708.1 acyl-CoA desaturase [Acinetobacter sp. GD03647]